MIALDPDHTTDPDYPVPFQHSKLDPTAPTWCRYVWVTPGDGDEPYMDDVPPYDTPIRGAIVLPRFPWQDEQRIRLMLERQGRRPGTPEGGSREALAMTTGTLASGSGSSGWMTWNGYGRPACGTAEVTTCR